ncbi:TIGR01777 family oxidoreductase [Novosphingobium sp.]|uniref:TIGR01777 family oxidoreductase n=1 Tax=Novosphingobium sp. TaxID=1874826 RepID=UPI0031DCDD34
MPTMTPRDPVSLASGLPGSHSILVTGGTGFIGTRLVAAMSAAGHHVTVLTRGGAKADTSRLPRVRIVKALSDIGNDTPVDAIVNLAGEPISNSPWTTSKRRRIMNSRLEVTNQVVSLIARLDRKPKVLVSGSAIGWYGLRGDEELTEASNGTPCFSRQVCVCWEQAALGAQSLGVRTVLLRTGLVLDHDGGMLARLLLPFKLGLGGTFGDGRHVMSWIHCDDLARLIVHIIAKPDLSGPVNGTAPQPVTNTVFTQTLAGVLHRPALLPIPAWPLRAMLGDFAHELLLSGQRVLPRAASDSGFVFWYPDLRGALDEIINDKG